MAESSRRAPRIVVSGPVGAGKTTLVNALAARLGVVALEEGVVEIFSRLHAWRALRGKPRDDLQRRQATSRLAQAFFDWGAKRAQAYHAHQGFVADRWEADLLELWLKVFSDFDCDQQTRRLLRDMRIKARTLSCAVLLAPSERAVETYNEVGLRRRQTFTLTFLSALVTDGLLRQCPGLRVITLEPESSVEQRVERVLAFVDEQSSHPSE